jgi:class 3 adenylate cyclase
LIIVLAGVIRTKSFSFDVWGDSLEVAELCQAASLPGRVTVSDSTYQLVKDRFRVEKASEVDFKGQKIQCFHVNHKPAGE